ncbi:hypothetical protein GTP46_06970 [Duganella sp. FT135W]|uniref:Membrane dipeptidase n=1 Tax=Duganella flavida TaxID=2692175 RepID=A0A6L8KD67_9BURK|nr:hypothetical protein [Duganella flavida]
MVLRVDHRSLAFVVQRQTVELLRRGCSERDIAKLWGGNFLRVLGEAQKLATAL